MRKTSAIMSTITYKIARSRVTGLRTVVEDLPHEPKCNDNDLQSEIDGLEELIAEGSDIIKSVTKLAKGCGKGLRSSTSDSLYVCTHKIGALLEQTDALARRIIIFMMERSHATSSKLTGLSDLRIDQNQLAKYKQEFVKQWRLPNGDKMRLARQEKAEGKTQPI